jgi:hypothetical protein
VRLSPSSLVSPKLPEFVGKNKHFLWYQPRLTSDRTQMQISTNIGALSTMPTSLRVPVIAHNSRANAVKPPSFDKAQTIRQTMIGVDLALSSCASASSRPGSPLEWPESSMFSDSLPATEEENFEKSMMLCESRHYNASDFRSDEGHIAAKIRAVSDLSDIQVKDDGRDAADNDSHDCRGTYYEDFCTRSSHAQNEDIAVRRIQGGIRATFPVQAVIAYDVDAKHYRETSALLPVGVPLPLPPRLAQVPTFARVSNQQKRSADVLLCESIVYPKTKCSRANEKLFISAGSTLSNGGVPNGNVALGPPPFAILSGSANSIRS